MYNSVIFVVLYCSVIDLRSADCEVVYECCKFTYSWDHSFPENNKVTNIWCENQCKAHAANYQYSGTLKSKCYCHATKPTCIDSTPMFTCTYRFSCPGHYLNKCGGYYVSFWKTGITVSKIGQSTQTVTNQPTPSVSSRESTTADFMNMITTVLSPAPVTQGTPSTIPELFSTTSESANTAISTLMTETSIQAQIDRTTETVTEKNTIAPSATSVSTRDSVMTEFINMITSGTSSAIATKSTSYTKRDLSSTTSQNANNDISSVLTEASTQATTANREWSMWDDWTFCEVNCVREDTTNGTQRRWRTCNCSKCSGNDMEERSCVKPGICKGMRPRKLLCKCPKRLINTKWHFLDGKNITDAEVKEMVLEDFNNNIKSEISVDKKTVSKEVRKKNSSVNKQKSSQSIGWGCIVFLILPVVFLIAIDILNCCIHFQSRFGDRKRNRIGRISNIKDSRDSSKPLQENVNITESYYASRCGNDFHPEEMKLETYRRRKDDNNEEDRDKWLKYM